MKILHIVIETENSLHRKWFDNPENSNKFKKSFRIHILNILCTNVNKTLP